MSSGLATDLSYQQWFNSATRKLLRVLYPDKRCSGTLASLVLAAGFAITDLPVQAAFTSIVSAVMMLRDFVTDASFRAGVECRTDAPLVVPRTHPFTPSNAAAFEETSLTVRAGFTATSSSLEVRRCVVALRRCGDFLFTILACA